MTSPRNLCSIGSSDDLGFQGEFDGVVEDVLALEDAVTRLGPSLAKRGVGRGAILDDDDRRGPALKGQ
jgi:hypothetical protein